MSGTPQTPAAELSAQTRSLRTPPRAPRPVGWRNPIARYARWLHTMWPAGTVEKLPQVEPDFSTNVPGLYIVGDLTGVPLLKFAADSGARAARAIAQNLASRGRDNPQAGGSVLDLLIIGAGVSGLAAALEARKLNLEFEILEAVEPFSTIVNFPKAKPIYTYPTDMTPAGQLQFRSQVHPKETLLEDLRRQTVARGIVPRIARAERVVRRGDLLEVILAQGQGSIRARRVIVAIGRSGNFRTLGVPGEDLNKVYNRLHDPKDFSGTNVLVVGGGDSALETAIALAECGAHVTISYRKPEFTRPKPANIERLNRLIANPAADVQVENPVSERVTTAIGDYMGRFREPGTIRLMLSSTVRAIRENEVELEDAQGRTVTLPNDVVFTMIGREPPLEFLRRSGVRIRGDWSIGSTAGLLAFLCFCVWLYLWKGYGWLQDELNPASLTDAISRIFSAAANQRTSLLYTMLASARSPSFYYTLAYSLLVVIFGIRRIRRRRTAYVAWQTVTLMLIQVLPLFVLPEILLPWMGRNGWFHDGTPGAGIADVFFERYDAAGEERAYWRSYGFVLAWPLMVYNVFTDQPMWGWLIVGSIQTFVLIPSLIYFWGKGAYCGWICSCGALAETLGDTHRHKMPHGPVWNRLNMTGQVILGLALIMLVLRIVGWIFPDSLPSAVFRSMLYGPTAGGVQLKALSYKFVVDVLLAGILGVGLYFWFSGRVWCRFACPLAALMHIYARFSRFRILADKSKCISCNICTSVCHQGIDVMNFANKGLPMADPQCVRCSACVQSCPTGVLEFGQIDRRTGAIIRKDPRWLAASPLLIRQVHVNGKPIEV
ncbi:NAD(P)-binding domain-containing protein [Fontivita pretiosa]|uniref:NAD(P)-binding domain-containing protein n=1 Tax=Fontivita pretiosa TaxID=2989684 RepID=UPI003D17781B